MLEHQALTPKTPKAVLIFLHSHGAQHAVSGHRVLVFDSKQAGMLVKQAPNNAF